MNQPGRAGQATGLVLWRRWVVATTIGTVIAFVAFLAVYVAFGEPSDLLFPVLMAGVGGIVGAFQQRVLRRAFGNADKWAITTGIGLGAAITLGVAIGERTGLAATTLIGVVDGAAGGAIIGTLQWLVLRTRIAGARWWVPASIGVWAIAGGAANAVGYLVDGLDIVALLVVAAATTGVALVALADRRSDDRARQSLTSVNVTPASYFGLKNQ